MCIWFSKTVISTTGRRKQIDQRQEMDCTKLKQTEKFSCNYNCVQLALTWLLEGPRYFVVQARWAQAWQLFLHIDYTYSSAFNDTEVSEEKHWGRNFKPQARQRVCHRKAWTCSCWTLRLQRYEYSNFTLVFPLCRHWSLESEHEEYMHCGSVWAPRMRWSWPESCGVLRMLWSVILGPALPTKRSTSHNDPRASPVQQLWQTGSLSRNQTQKKMAES